MRAQQPAERGRERKSRPGWDGENRGSGAQSGKDKNALSAASKKAQQKRSPVSCVGLDRCAAKGQRSSNRWRDGSADCGPDGGFVCFHSTRCFHTAMQQYVQLPPPSQKVASPQCLSSPAGEEH